MGKVKKEKNIQKKKIKKQEEEEKKIEQEYEKKFKEDLNIIQSQAGVGREVAIELYQNNDLDVVKALSCHWHESSQNSANNETEQNVKKEMNEAQQNIENLRKYADEKDNIFTQIQEKNRPQWMSSPSDSPTTENLTQETLEQHQPQNEPSAEN